ncbi:hypothetical protein KFE25_000441 [Diacronema lutheri]|uniref:Uncharacterized protein n=1 Tax=Diacronema lutheri TaxID=2081491 RepID=A0A8J5XXA4_DIALT|nr:hypothetical protein KFE25_000441 [Diacronema lutheri]
MASTRAGQDASANVEERMLLAPSPEEQRRLDENRKRRDVQSQKMSELLLKGWKMLGEHCPETGEVPLMQQPKSGRKFSVAIGKFIDELDRCEEQPAPAAPTAPSPTPDVPRVGVAAQPPSLPAPAPPPPPTVARVPAAAPGAPSSVASALDSAADEVTAKLQTYSAQLAGLGPLDAQLVLALIGECARALRDLNAARATAQ